MPRLINLIRVLFYHLGYAAALVALGVVSTLIRPFRLSSQSNYRLLMWYAPFLIWWARWSLGVRHKVIGLDNLPAHNCVVISNHQSAWETMFLSSLFSPNASVLKRELLDMVFFGKALAMVDPIAIERQKPAQALKQLIQQGTDRLRAGRWVIIYPEGTRVAPGEYLEFNPGGFLLALKAGADIVPIAHNAGTVWHGNWLRWAPGEITVVIGPLIPVANRSRDDVISEAEQWIRNTMSALPGNSGASAMVTSARGG